jgi:hypothetical protein
MGFYYFESILEEAGFSFRLYSVRISFIVNGREGSGTSRSLSSASFLIFGSALSVEEKSSNKDIMQYPRSCDRKAAF